MRKFEFVKDYNNEGKLPTRADNGSAGYDFYTPYTLEIAPKSTVVFKTNVKAAMEKDEVLLLYVRSSIGIKKHLMLCNGTGVIDAGYRDEIKLAVHNFGEQSQIIEDGQRIGQFMILPRPKVNLTIVPDDDEFKNGDRGGGIGSTGKC